MIYSQYIYGGIIPIALALEELGFKNSICDSLFEEEYSKTIPKIDYNTNPISKDSNISKYTIVASFIILPYSS